MNPKAVIWKISRLFNFNPFTVSFPFGSENKTSLFQLEIINGGLWRKNQEREPMIFALL
ncbi:MAG: hypothetical protein V1896_00050 [Candidatus Zambryskibacteria bacterium]